jgi:site-specific DNA recombinase
MVGELKKSRYVYYPCTGNRGKCPELYTREEVLSMQFAAVLQELVIPNDVLDWLRDEVVSADRTEAAARATVIRRHEEDIRRFETRIETMYEGKLRGDITAEFFNRKATE